MSESEKYFESHHRKDQKPDDSDSNIAVPISDVSSITGSVKHFKQPASSSERQIKFEKAQKCLENAVLVSKRIKEHRKATAELLGRPFEDDVTDTASDAGTTISEKTGYSVATDTSTMSVQEALNIPGISESLANTLKQKEVLMERIKQYKEISKRPIKKSTPIQSKGLTSDLVDKKSIETTDASKLLNIVKEKENSLSVMQVKMKAMENTILDLQEKITEKDQIIEAKNKATTLISDSLSKKEREALALLEETKEQMTKMQSNFIAIETEWKEEKQTLLNEIHEKDISIKSLEEANSILEKSRLEISVDNSKFSEELELKTKEIIDLQEKLQQLSQSSIQEIKEDKEVVEEKGSLEISSMEELNKKIEILEQLNFEIRQTNKELENQLATQSETKQIVSPSKKGSPLPTRKGTRNTSSKMKSPWSHLSSESLPQEQEKKGKPDKSKSDMILQSLNKEILDKEYIISEKNVLISQLQTTIQEKESNINELQSLIQTKELAEKVDASICTDIDIPKEIDTTEAPLNLKELEDKLKLAEDQIANLNTEIDAANKNMIKVKSNSKIKLKQLQKTIDNFSKVSDSNAEIVKLNEEIHQLTQKVAELEEEKGNLQLHLVDYDSGRLTESDVYKKLVEMENLADTRLKSISLLETQKFDLVQELHSLQQKNLEMEDKLADISQLQSEQVSSEMKSVQLEEQIDNLLASKKELELVIDNFKLDKDQLEGSNKLLQDEKDELTLKLENYIQENIELSEKLGKLSAEKVSSAESIEIVDSLTSQEKFELEEYSKGLQTEQKSEDSEYSTSDKHDSDSNEKLVEEIAELKNRIELFTVERQEVMERMSKLSLENESLNEVISELREQCNSLTNSIEALNQEKRQLLSINDDINHQLEELKHEKSEILKETAEVVKSSVADDVTDSVLVEAIHHDDKTTGDKGARTKSVKQLTKEILKLKNTIKEREDDIADCQMKILSLEEQQEKHKEILQSNSTFEKLVRKLTDENNELKKEIENINKDNRAEQQLNVVQAHEMLQIEAQKLHQDYSAAINARDARIHELENVLIEYEKQVINYGNSLQQKDKELSEYMNQITKLNDVSQKLKSTIDLLEEEKAKDQNSEVIKSLNKQIGLYQKTLSDYEEKLRILEEEKSQLVSMKTKLENKSSNLEVELKKLQDLLAEKQVLVQELQSQQVKHSEELADVQLQAKERDEEIHEIKLQLRKESIDNEKLHNIVVQKSNEINEITKLYEGAKESLKSVSVDKNSQIEQFTSLEAKNKELMDKLKKFAASIKKKSAMYTELESQLHDIQKKLEVKNEQYEQLLIQVETIPALQEKLKHAEEEFNRLQYLKVSVEQKSKEILELQSGIELMKNKSFNDDATIAGLNESADILNKDMYLLREENHNLKTQIEGLNNKIVECEIDQKNNANLVTKISCLESELNQKQVQIAELSYQVEIQSEKLNQVQYGHDAKVQEREMYIENLQSEIDKYKNRINRLEECVSTMENRRQSLERKADDLDVQLHEKQKAYDDYMNQEDELVNRLAFLIDHDRVVEKQLHEIEGENKELRFKGQNLTEELNSLKEIYQDLQEKCNVLEIKANTVESIESELLMCQNNMRELDNNLKRRTSEQETLIAQKKRDIEELESEFNIQIENSIREKKLLNEKHEKIIDRVTQLELKLEEYRNTIENLNINIRELEAENQKLIQKNSSHEKTSAPDYTEQYISEINRLNSVLNSKNYEISELNNSLQLMHTNNLSQISALECKNRALAEKHDTLLHQVNNLNADIEALTQNINDIQLTVAQKDEQIKQLLEKKKLVFEMNIPKTEGLTISSTIEEMDSEQPSFDMSSLQSQIISDNEPLLTEDKQVVKRSIEKTQYSQTNPDTEGIMEPQIVPKKTYLCFKKDESNHEIPEADPFNSDEGWGLEYQENSDDVVPGMSHLNQQIQQLKEANENLKLELKTANSKLLKVVKKCKELKCANEVLSNELKISKQISESSILDMAIENELSSNLKLLETKVQELSNQVNDEKRDKETAKKQNETLRKTNEKLLLTKEKLENELESWKVNYKQVSNKLSTVQWSEDSTDLGDSQVSQSTSIHKPTVNYDLQNDLDKLEKENDELQSMVDNLNAQNKDLHKQQTILKEEINRLTNNMQEQQICPNCEKLSVQLEEIQNKYKLLEQTNSELNNLVKDLEVKYHDAKVTSESLQKHVEVKDEAYKNIETELLDKNRKLLEEIQSLHLFENEANSTILDLNSELEKLRSQLLIAQEKPLTQTTPDMDTFVLTEKYNSMEQHCLDLKQAVDKTSTKLQDKEQENKVLLDKIKNYEGHVDDLTTKLHNLNTENDQLLSTVTELRSSVSSAMDQRGFEIAELWKQHLAQREGEFQKLEQDLRSELISSESKYEQLLENVQSSNQEETNKIVMMEQINSLQNKLKEKEEHLISIQNKYAESMNQLDMLRSEMEDEKVINENKLFVNQEDNEKLILELNKKYKESCDGLNSELTSLRMELDATKKVNIELGQQIETLHSNYKSQISDISMQLQGKESEIFQKTHEFTTDLKQRNEEFETVRKQLIEYEKKLEEITYEKESELAILRLKIHERTEKYDQLNKSLESDKNSLAESLKEKIVECTNLNKQIHELNAVLEEYSNKAAETQLVLESQELEIVTLKSELSDLKDALRTASTKIEKHVTFASDTKQGHETETPQQIEKDLLDTIPRAELDLALYMLHQRDVRCEELTMELTQLLEERDTLQLRLSDSIRSFEDLKLRYNSAGLDVSVSSSSEGVSELPSFTVEKERQFVDTHRGQTSRSSSISDPDGEKPKLQAKLSELRSVRHSRDVRLRQDSEHRQLDMRLLQRDVASLPPEAVERLAQAHHTLSRDTQSTPTVLLNWLRGKSTPKVVHM